MFIGLAHHVWPSAHCHSSGVWALTYVVDRHAPPRARARACIIPIVCFWDIVREAARDGHGGRARGGLATYVAIAGKAAISLRNACQVAMLR